MKNRTPPTITEIGQEAGLSRKSASRFFNGTEIRDNPAIMCAAYKLYKERAVSAHDIYVSLSQSGYSDTWTDALVSSMFDSDDMPKELATIEVRTILKVLCDIAESKVQVEEVLFKVDDDSRFFAHLIVKGTLCSLFIGNDGLTLTIGGIPFTELGKCRLCDILESFYLAKH